MSLTNAKAQQIAHLWVEGRTLEDIAVVGLSQGWSRREAEQIAADNGWKISAGRTHPRSRRNQPAPVTPPVSTAKVVAGSYRRPVRAPQPTVVVEKFLTVRETAALMRVSTETVRRLVVKEELRAKRIGRSVRIPVSSYETYMAKAEMGGAV